MMTHSVRTGLPSWKWVAIQLMRRPWRNYGTNRLPTLPAQNGRVFSRWVLQPEDSADKPAVETIPLCLAEASLTL